MEWLKKTYVYIFATVGLVLIIIGSVQLINLALKAWIFTQADIYRMYPAPVTVEGDKQQPDPKQMEEYQRAELVSQRQRSAANGIALIIVGVPLFAYHFRIIRKDIKG